MPFGYKALEPGVKPQIVDRAINGGGIRDTARVPETSKNTVIGLLVNKVEFGLDIYA
jgi:transposase-like protein